MSSLRDELRAAVEAARDRAVAAGELRPRGGASPPTPRAARARGARRLRHQRGHAARPGRALAPMAIAEILVRHLVLPTGRGRGRPSRGRASSTGDWTRHGSPARCPPSWRPARARGVRGLAGEKINVEFISANPTGPLHIGNGRGGFIGDALATCWRRRAQVTREYYFNDYGARSATSACRSWPGATASEAEDGYRGAYMVSWQRRCRTRSGHRRPLEGRCGEIGPWEPGVRRHQAQHRRLRMRIDVWTDPRARSTSEGWVSRGHRRSCGAAGHVYEDEGATWFRSTTFGDDKDRVLIRSNGQPTYFAADIGYLPRSSARVHELIYLWGADHHGTVARNGAAARRWATIPTRCSGC